MFIRRIMFTPRGTQTLPQFILSFLLIAIASAELSKPFVWKCCAKGKQLNAGAKSCISAEEINDTSLNVEFLQPPIDKGIHNWLPPDHSSILLAFYNMLPKVTMDISGIEVHEETHSFKLLNFDGSKTIHPSMIQEERYCFDTIQSPNNSRVVYKSWKLKSIFKCCFKSEKINISAGLCQKSAHSTIDITKEELLQKYSLGNHSWIPPTILAYTYKVKYDYFKYLYNAIVILAEGTDFNFNVIPSTSEATMIYAQGKNILGDKVAGVTNNFCFDETAGNSSQRVVLVSFSPKTTPLYKCCGKGMQFDILNQTCIGDKQIDIPLVQTETVYPPIEEIHHWIPTPFQSFPITVHYNILSLVSVKNFKILIFQNYFNVSIDNFQDNIHDSMIQEQLFCYDTVKYAEGLRVLVRAVKLKQIFKCCSWNERLTARADSCESTQRQYQGGLDVFRWLPSYISQFEINLRPSFLTQGYLFNTIIPDTSNLSLEGVTSPYGNAAISFRDENRSVAGVSDTFCFDEVAQGPLAPRVLLAFVPRAYKCCRQGEHFNDKNLQCTSSGSHATSSAKNGYVDWKTDPNESFWLPTSLRDDRVPVIYNYINKILDFTTHHGLVSEESSWKLNYARNKMPTLSLNSTDLSGRPYIVETQYFCFESIANLSRVVYFSKPYFNRYLLKCCFPGEILSVHGRCERHQGTDWTPGDSKFREEFHQGNSIHNINPPLNINCYYLKYHILPMHSERASRYFQGEHSDKGKYGKTVYCNDWQRTEDGGLREVVASCSWPMYAFEYDRVRMLGLVAVGLLMVAALLASVDQKIRSSAHGRALLCHALCHAATNSLQMAAHFHQPSSASACYPYAFCTYFFMVAANTWLTAITFNMYKNFGGTLGELASRPTPGMVCKRFAKLSLFAWGISAVLTVISVTMFIQGQQNLGLIGATPSFFETRTCLVEQASFQASASSSRRIIHNPLGAVYYYYIPVALLAATNMAFIVMTARIVSGLRKGSSILRQNAPTKNVGKRFFILRPKRALFFAKLLLMTGGVELALEVAAWSSGREGSSLHLPTGNVFLFPLLSTVLDFARALIVFWLTTAHLWVRAIGSAHARARATLSTMSNNTGSEMATQWVRARCQLLWRFCRRRQATQRQNAAQVHYGAQDQTISTIVQSE